MSSQPTSVRRVLPYPERGDWLGAGSEARWLGEGARRSPQMQALWERLVVENAGAPKLGDIPVAEMRELRHVAWKRWNQDLPDMARVERLSVPNPLSGGTVGCELVVPHDAKAGAVLFAHGGGWVLGDLGTHAKLARFIARATQRPVLSVGYRLAPEYPYPAPLQDVIAAWRWLYAKREFGGARVMVGDSAGANMLTAAMFHEISAELPVARAAVLYYGVFGADFDTPSYRRFGEGFGLTRGVMQLFFDYYVEKDRRGDPLVCPVAADIALLAKLPPLYLAAAGLDPLLWDTFHLATRLAEAGVPHEVCVHEGMHHNFLQMADALGEAHRAIGDAADWLQQHFDREF